MGIVCKGESRQTGHSPLMDIFAPTPARKPAFFLFCLSVLFQLPFEAAEREKRFWHVLSERDLQLNLNKKK